MHLLAFSSPVYKEICNIKRQTIRQNSGCGEKAGWLGLLVPHERNIQIRMTFLLSEKCKEDDNSSGAWAFRNQCSRRDGGREKRAEGHRGEVQT